MSRAEVQVDDRSNKVLVYRWVGRSLRLIGTVFTSVFGPSGTSHSVGLVPDPGAVAGTTKFLREDGTWVAPSGGGGNDILDWLGF